MKTPIVILHGWAKKGDDYHELKEIFEAKGYQFFCPDLPGFGSQPLRKPVMHIDDYIEFVLDFLKKNKLKKVILIGHSFGGRIAAKLTAKHPLHVEKLIVTGAPLIKEKLPAKKKIVFHLVKIGKKILRSPFIRKIVYKIIGEWDYYKLSDEMRGTFKAVIAEDISPNLPYIETPTLVLWGKNDTFVLPMIGKKIANIMPHGIYKEIPNTSHRLPYENPTAFAKAVVEFIE